MSDFDVCNVVIDNRSKTCKAGFEGDDTPKTIISSILGRPKFQVSHLSYDKEHCYIQI